MKYKVLIIPSAEKEMDKLPNPAYNNLKNKILSLQETPKPQGIKKLRHREEYRLRVGDYRVLYTIDDSDKSVTIVAVGHRKEIYR